MHFGIYPAAFIFIPDSREQDPAGTTAKNVSTKIADRKFVSKVGQSSKALPFTAVDYGKGSKPPSTQQDAQSSYPALQRSSGVGA